MGNVSLIGVATMSGKTLNLKLLKIDLTVVVLLFASACVIHRAAEAANAPERALATKILDEAGVTGGLIVHVGCGDGKLSAALRANDGYLVHGVDVSADTVDAARTHIQSLGLYGPVSVDTFDGEHLPYADNLVNLVVASGKGRSAARVGSRRNRPLRQSEIGDRESEMRQAMARYN